MAELNFETGVQTFTVNGKSEVAFNPTDSAFVERLFNAFDTLDKKQDAYKEEISKLSNNREIFAIARRRDNEMREIIDGIFGRPISADVFGSMNTYAMADGLPVWCNLLLTVMDQVDTTFAREQKATNPRIAKYTAKYHK